MAETVLEGMMTLDQGDKVVVVPGVADVGAAMQRFKWPDYVMFLIMLLLCVIVGLYYGFYRVSTNTQDYLMGGKNMPMFPVVMSLIASFISGISILGIPTEAYLYGIQYGYILGGVALMGFVMNYVYLPVFYNLNLTSTYEYHELRFDKNVRLFGSILFTIKLVVTGVNVHLLTPTVCLICIFYTSLGGLKAVVWTDVIQGIIMFAAMLLVAVKGTLDIGGFDVVWQRNWNSGRIEGPNFDMNPLSRHTFWSLVIGGCVYFLQAGAIDQAMIQRYLSLPSLRKAKRAVWMFVLGIFAIVLLCGYCGILMYAAFHKCDPLTTTLAREKDQLLPLLVMEVLGDYPGLSGIFVAGILSASLSSLSTGLNSMAAVVLEDFYKFFFPKPLTEKQASILMKLTVVFLGSICVGLVYVVENLGAVLQGALIGGASSLFFMCWLCFSAQAAISSGDLYFPEKPLSTEGCHYHFTPKHSSRVNIQLTTAPNSTGVMHTEEEFILYHLSYLWFTLIGALVSILIGLIVSLLTKPLDPRDVDPSLLASCVRRYIKPRDFPNQPADGIIYAYEITRTECTEWDTVNVKTTNLQRNEAEDAHLTAKFMSNRFSISIRQSPSHLLTPVISYESAPNSGNAVRTIN